MHWFEENLIENAIEFARQPVQAPGRKVLIEGRKGSGKSAFVDFLLSQMKRNVFIVTRVNCAKYIREPQDIIFEVLQQNSTSLKSEFRLFLKKFSKGSRSFIKNKLAKLPQFQVNESDWYEEIFSQFLNHLGEKNTLTFIFENVQNADSFQIEKLERFIDKFNYLPIQSIFTYDETGPFFREFGPCKRFILEKLSIQTTEKCIQEFFQTSPLNARLITNHLYLKTAGIPLKIRFLTNTVYKSVLGSTDDEVINIQKLQKIKISGEWDQIFQIASGEMNESALYLLGFIAHLDNPILESDLQLICKDFKLSKDLLKIWVDAGFIKKISELGGQIAFSLDFREWENWLRTNIPVEKLEKILVNVYLLVKTGKLSGNYQISHLLYDMDKLEYAIELAREEAKWLMEQNKFSQAADRLYFLVRMWDLNSDQVQDIDWILSKLSDIYLHIRAYDNAFEILKRQRLMISEKSKNEPAAEAHQKWVEVNLKMAESLIAMDAYLEARYLIRESQIKKYCDLASKGRCVEFTGDIEANLGHFEYASKNYHEAVGYYQKANKAEDILRVYKKFKQLLRNDPESFIELNTKIYGLLLRLNTKPEYLNGIWLDLIKQYMQAKEYRQAVKLCISLRRNLLQVYEPKIHFQLVLYFTEIYSQFGKWQLAISLMRREGENLYVQHRASLRVQTLIQLGMLFKEQARYGEAKTTLEQGLEICFQFDYQMQQYEIKLHLGHIYLLAHGMLRAHEYLQQAHSWASREKDKEILLLANLYLSYYELQNMRIEKARKFLRDAKKLVNLSQNLIDYLNYLFYLGAWLYAANRLDHLGSVINLMKKKSNNLPRYQATADYLLTKLNISEKNYQDAERSFRSGQKIAQKWNLPQIQYLLNCEVVRLYQASGKDGKFLPALKKTIAFFGKMKENMQDEILGTQFIQARFHQDIIQWADEYKVNQIKE